MVGGRDCLVFGMMFSIPNAGYRTNTDIAAIGRAAVAIFARGSDGVVDQ
jgi:hypothetical protein